MKREYTISDREFRRLHGRAYRAQQKDHLEVCGVVVADAANEIRLVFLVNVSTEPYRFEIRRQDVQGVRKTGLGPGERLLGSFHSHPVSEAVPSEGDLQRGFYGGVELIYDVCGREARLWRRSRGPSKRVVELPLRKLPRRR